MDNQKHLCPSAPYSDGVQLLGIVNEQKEVSILESPIELSSEFGDAIRESSSVGNRFRFVNKCVKSGCQNWIDNSCNVIKIVLESIEQNYWKENLPACSIRNECRWFQQESSNACKVCTLVKFEK